jgi:hypothetical protein
LCLASKTVYNLLPEKRHVCADEHERAHDEHLALETADEYIHGDYSRSPDADRVSVYACPACLKRFTSASNLDRHLVNNSTCKRWIDMGKADIGGRTDWDLEHLRGSESLQGH